MADPRRLIAGIEGGGTKMVLGIGSIELGSIATARVPTGDPDETIAAMADFFAQAGEGRRLAALGIASFGPVDLDRSSPTYGHILATPKPGWKGFDLLGRMRAALGGVPAGIDTDVNAAAMAEARFGDSDDLAYVTVGTGIGVGLVINGRPVHGAGHPEGGHMLLRRHPAHADFAGVCPFHGDCVEGLASGSAIMAAWGKSLADLPHDHVAWGVEADYLAQLCAVLILTVAPRRIVLGGGVMSQQALFPAVRDRAAALLAGYGRGVDRATLEARIVPPMSKGPPGLLGAYLLGEQATA